MGDIMGKRVVLCAQGRKEGLGEEGLSGDRHTSTCLHTHPHTHTHTLLLVWTVRTRTHTLAGVDSEYTHTHTHTHTHTLLLVWTVRTGPSVCQAPVECVALRAKR